MSIAFFTDGRDEGEKVHIRTPAVLATLALALMAASIALPLGVSFVAGGMASMIVLTVYLLPALPIVTAASIIVVAGLIGAAVVRTWRGFERATDTMETTHSH